MFSSTRNKLTGSNHHPYNGGWTVLHGFVLPWISGVSLPKNHDLGLGEFGLKPLHCWISPLLSTNAPRFGCSSSGEAFGQGGRFDLKGHVILPF